jgi:hypothetical protein
VYSRTHAPTPEQRAEQNGMIVQDYLTQFWHVRAGVQEWGSIRVRDLPARIGRNASSIFGHNTALLFAPVFFRSPAISGREVLDPGIRANPLACTLSALILLGLLVTLRRGIGLGELTTLATLGITVLWPWPTYRFVLPLLPFLLFYLLMGLSQLPRGPGKWWRGPLPFARRMMPLVTVLVVALALIDHVGFLRQGSYHASARVLPWVTLFEENRAALAWMRENVPPDVVVASSNPSMVYLYAGRQSVGADNAAANWERWRRMKVGYYALLSAAPQRPPDGFEARFPVAYPPRGPLGLRVVDLGQSERGTPATSTRATR